MLHLQHTQPHEWLHRLQRSHEYLYTCQQPITTYSRCALPLRVHYHGARYTGFVSCLLYDDVYVKPATRENLSYLFLFIRRFCTKNGYTFCDHLFKKKAVTKDRHSQRKRWYPLQSGDFTGLYSVQSYSVFKKDNTFPGNPSDEAAFYSNSESTCIVCTRKTEIHFLDLQQFKASYSL